MVSELQNQLLHRFRQSTDSGTKECEWPGCSDEGLCRAPKSPDELQSFRWFCKDHAREYNKSWNYYSGMSDEEVEADVRRDTVWRRPTWRLGTNGFLGAEYGGFDPSQLDDPLGIFEESVNSSKNEEQKPSTSSVQRQALEVFGLSVPVNADAVKQRYKELVKRYHPDAVQHESDETKALSDEKIKEVNQAYQVLLDFLQV